MNLKNIHLKEVYEGKGVDLNKKGSQKIAADIGDNLSRKSSCQGDLRMWREEEILLIFLPVRKWGNDQSDA